MDHVMETSYTRLMLNLAALALHGYDINTEVETLNKAKEISDETWRMLGLSFDAIDHWDEVFKHNVRILHGTPQ